MRPIPLTVAIPSDKVDPELTFKLQAAIASVGERFWADLEMHHHGRHALAAFPDATARNARHDTLHI